MKRENSVLIIAGPSGAGKTVVAKAIVEKDERFTFLRSTTTRARRGDEHDDEYLYATEEEFFAAVDRGEFVEHMKYGSAYYGTTKAEMNAALDRGQIPLLVLDLCGVESLGVAEDYSACSVYIYAPLEVIDARLRARYRCEGVTGGDEACRTRRARNISDFLSLPEYAPHIHRFIENVDTVEDCRDRVMACFEGYCDGEKKDTEAVARRAEELKRSAEAQ